MRSARELRASIAALIGRAAKLDSEIHEHAVECLEHAETHGDMTLIDKLVKELEANAPGQRTATLREWTEKFSPLRWNNKTGLIGKLEDNVPNFTPFDLETAAKTPYYTFGKEQRPRELTLDQLRKTLAGMISKVEKAAAGEGKTTIAEGEDVDAMKDLARKASLIVNDDVQVLTREANDDDEETSESLAVANAAVA